MTETVSTIVQLVGLVGAAAAMTYWGGRISRGLEAVDSRLGEMKTTIEKVDQRVNDHGERIARLEPRSASR